MFPYESYFYSSGGIEEGWGPKDLLTNRVTCTVGFGLGSLLAISILASFGPAVRPGQCRPGDSWHLGARSGDPVR